MTDALATARLGKTDETDAPERAGAQDGTGAAETSSDKGVTPVIDAQDLFDQARHGNGAAVQAAADGEVQGGTEPHVPQVSRASIDDALLLLDFLAQQGRAIDKTDILTIVTASARFGTIHWDQELESQFWVARCKLSNLALPDSVQSIRRASAHSEGGS
jgi:hypothetical protein